VLFCTGDESENLVLESFDELIHGVFGGEPVHVGFVVGCVLRRVVCMSYCGVSEKLNIEVNRWRVYVTGGVCYDFVAHVLPLSIAVQNKQSVFVARVCSSCFWMGQARGTGVDEMFPWIYERRHEV
jgi:hypothetical protein